MNFKRIGILVFFVGTSLLLSGQITVPINKIDLDDYNRERETIAFMGIDLSQTWLYLVKDNVVSSNKHKIQEVYYSKNGLPERIVNYDENSNIRHFTSVKYNSSHLPFEEIRFTADSTLLSGVLYEYENSGILSKMTFYGNNQKIISTHVYQRYNDSIVISVYDKDAKPSYKDLMLFVNGTVDGHLKKMLRFDNSDNKIQEITYEYDDYSAIRRKLVYDGKNLATRREYVYNEEGALVRTVTYDANGNVLADSSFEHDTYGNVSRIIDFNSVENLTKMYFISYLTKVE